MTRYYTDAPCLTDHGLPRYRNRSVAAAHIPAGWTNRARIYGCGGHYHVGVWWPSADTPTPIQEAAA